MFKKLQLIKKLATPFFREKTTLFRRSQRVWVGAGNHGGAYAPALTPQAQQQIIIYRASPGVEPKKPFDGGKD